MIPRALIFSTLPVVMLAYFFDPAQNELGEHPAFADRYPHSASGPHVPQPTKEQKLTEEEWRERRRLLADERPITTMYADCAEDLRPGQFLCQPPDIDPETQQPRNCHQETLDALRSCTAIDGIVCRETGNRTFYDRVPCEWTNGYQFDTALLLSVFLGMFGADRFYLGYPALGLLKFSTLGFFFLGHLLDIILIASQVVGPADGSSYVIAYFGPGIKILGLDESTERRPQPDWF